MPIVTSAKSSPLHWWRPEWPACVSDIHARVDAGPGTSDRDASLRRQTGGLVVPVGEQPLLRRPQPLPKWSCGAEAGDREGYRHVMRWVRRIIFGGLTLLSALLLIGTVTLWARTRWVDEDLFYSLPAFGKLWQVDI